MAALCHVPFHVLVPHRGLTQKYGDWAPLIQFAVYMVSILVVALCARIADRFSARRHAKEEPIEARKRAEARRIISQRVR